MEYIKELYACNIDDQNIWCKCPFQKKNFLHKFENKTQSLLNNEKERKIEEPINCECGFSVIVNVGNYTRRISLKKNKTQTGYTLDLKSKNRINLLYKLEQEGRRNFKQNNEMIKNNDGIIRFE